MLIFFWKCSKFHAHFTNAIKNREKIFSFLDHDVWNCCRKFCILLPEYLSSTVNALTNSLSASIISEIITLEYSSFFWKCSKFHAHFRNAIKNPDKVFCFWDNGVWNCCGKFCILLPEYWSSAVNALTNSLKISYQTEGNFLQLNLPRIDKKRG